MLRRNWKGGEDSVEKRERVLSRLRSLVSRAERENDPERLLGREGEAAALYFGEFRHLISTGRNLRGDFTWAKRSRRPPTDPINALLSFTYSLAVRTFTVALETAGLDPLLGFFHRPRPGRPALALDMMEPFRSILCDSTVIMVINNGEVRDVDFVRNGPGVRHETVGAPGAHRRLGTTTGPRSRPSRLRLSDQHAPHHRRAVPPSGPSPARRDTAHPALHAALTVVPEERLFVVAYDIADRRRWRRVLTIVEGYGDRLQLSVFQCRLTSRRRVELAARLEEVIRQGSGQRLVPRSGAGGQGDSARREPRQALRGHPAAGTRPLRLILVAGPAEDARALQQARFSGERSQSAKWLIVGLLLA